MVELDKVLDTQTIDVGIVSHALTGEMLAQIETVGSNSLCKLGEGDVVLQIELDSSQSCSSNVPMFFADEGARTKGYPPLSPYH